MRIQVRRRWRRARLLRSAVLRVSKGNEALIEVNEDTHVGCIGLVVLTGVRPVRSVIRQEQSTAVERCCEARNDGIGLRVATGGEGASAVAKDVPRCWLCKCAPITEVQDAGSIHFALDFTVRCLRVDGERLGLEFAPHCEAVQSAVCA